MPLVPGWPMQLILIEFLIFEEFFQVSPAPFRYFVWLSFYYTYGLLSLFAASVVYYSIVDGNIDDAFLIEQSTGKIKVANKLDYENIKQVISLTL